MKTNGSQNPSSTLKSVVGKVGGVAYPVRLFFKEVTEWNGRLEWIKNDGSYFVES